MLVSLTCHKGSVCVRTHKYTHPYACIHTCRVQNIIYFDESTIMGEWSHWEDLNSVSEYADETTGK